MSARTITIDELHAAFERGGASQLILDVRGRDEFAAGHVPGARNAPVDEITRRPDHYTRVLRPYRDVYFHCTAGERSERAAKALTSAGLRNVHWVREGGFPEWKERGYPVATAPGREATAAARSGGGRSGGGFLRELVIGTVAGLVADLAVAPADRLFAGLVSPEQKAREKRMRPASPHRIAGPRVARQLLGRRLDAGERRFARAAFTIAYGVVWGLVYHAIRQRIPAARRLGGVPFGAAFFLACDGVIAPLLRLTPAPHRVPWQLNAKELANHLVWTAAAELTERGARRVAPGAKSAP